MTQPNRPGFLTDVRNILAACLCWLVCICGLAYLVSGKLVAEKTLTNFVFPVGAIWLLLSGWTLQLIATRRFGQAAIAGLGWIVLTLTSTTPLPDACSAFLEYACLETHQPPVYDPSQDEPLDILIVLGGGVWDGPRRAQAGASGDRIVYAAELYHQGCARQLVTTGEPIRALGPQTARSLGEMTAEIWQKLDVPSESIRILPGRNTYEEIQAIKAISSEFANARVGLLTSACHLPRALRLANDQGMSQIIPVAADYLFSKGPRSFIDYLPRIENLNRFTRCQHELLAWLVSR